MTFSYPQSLARSRHSLLGKVSIIGSEKGARYLQAVAAGVRIRPQIFTSTPTLFISPWHSKRLQVHSDQFSINLDFPITVQPLPDSPVFVWAKSRSGPLHFYLLFLPLCSPISLTLSTFVFWWWKSCQSFGAKEALPKSSLCARLLCLFCEKVERFFHRRYNDKRHPIILSSLRRALPWRHRATTIGRGSVSYAQSPCAF